MIGLIVNPVAGLGGPVGLKGTDQLAEEALSRGAIPQAENRAVRMLQHLKPDLDTDILTCSGSMGAHAAEEAGISYTIAYDPAHPTTSSDTIEAARIMEKTPDLDLLVFCGGDGTARDISSAVSVPILGVPAGCKMYSACFAVTPEAAAEAARSFMKVREVELSEILDIDEVLYRRGRFSVKLFGYAAVPKSQVVQKSKMICQSTQKNAIARFMQELVRKDTLYIIGAGTTTGTIKEALTAEKTLLGVDAIKGETMVKKDCSEQDLLTLLRHEKRAKIIVSPIGGQGFIFGRGTQQISPEVIQMVGPDNIIVVAAPEKLQTTPFLHVDTGNPDLDLKLKGEILVVCGYRLAARKKVV
ncbi:MAG: ATP-NAD kinase family protein [Theionarchaea archaeon]|nr:ATP-NAD kinase family protein [Theionarchaea archaeon]